MTSTQRYRLPVRRYIVELFHQEMNQELVKALNDAAKRLKASPSYKPPPTDTIRMSVFGRVGKSRRPSESDESEDDGMGTPAVAPTAAVEQLTINLQPLKKIVGFAVWHFFPNGHFLLSHHSLTASMEFWPQSLPFIYSPCIIVQLLY